MIAFIKVDVFLMYFSLILLLVDCRAPVVEYTCWIMVFPASILIKMGNWNLHARMQGSVALYDMHQLQLIVTGFVNNV